jgi:DNA-binding transcriptional regulator YdaS (Cro superfamily)
MTDSNKPLPASPFVWLGISKGAVSQWKAENRRVPAAHCLAIERATNGAVTRRDLRPDDFHLIWPDLDTATTEAREAV